MWTIKSLLDWTADYFRKNHIDTPRLDAELLLAHLLGISKLDVYLKFDRPMSENELAGFKALVKRRVAHEPVAYLTGKKEFWSREFLVTPDVLIPRPDTERLVEIVLDQLSGQKKVFPPNANQNLSGFEMGLGSGNVSITLLAELPQLHMTAVEISAGAIAVAKKNAEKLGVMNRLTVIEGDFFDFSGERASSFPYHFVVSNPPYIGQNEKNTLSLTVRDHEPEQALFADNDGLAFYPVISRFAKNTLLSGGFVAVEVGETQAKAVSQIFLQAGFTDVNIYRDYDGHERVVKALCL